MYYFLSYLYATLIYLNNTEELTSSFPTTSRIFVLATDSKSVSASSGLEFHQNHSANGSCLPTGWPIISKQLKQQASMCNQVANALAPRSTSFAVERTGDLSIISYQNSKSCLQRNLPRSTSKLNRTKRSLVDTDYMDGYSMDSEISVSSSDSPEKPTIARLESGGFIIGYQSTIEVKVLPYTPSYIPGDVDTISQSSHQNNHVAGLSNNEYVLIWSVLNGFNYEIWYAYFDSDENIVNQGQATSSTITNYIEPKAQKYTSSGKFLVFWHEQNRINYQIVSSAGPSGSTALQLNSDVSDEQKYPFPSQLSNGDIIVVWQYHTSSQGYTVKAAIIPTSGTVSEFSISSGISSEENRPKVVGLSDGSFVVSWIKDSSNMYASHYNSDGTVSTSQFQIDDDVTTAGSCNTFDISSLDSGGFVISWEFQTNRKRVYLRAFDSNMQAEGPTFEVFSANYAREHPGVLGLSDGFVVVWQQGDGIDRRAFNRCTVDNCKKCEISLSSCTECKDSYELEGNQCYPGCDSSCSQCDFGVCSCSTNAEVQIDGTCICSENYYLSSSSPAECTICDPMCKTCNGNSDSNCLSCHYDMILEDNSCVCGEGYFENSLSCFPCEGTCKTCNGSENDNCLSCHNNMTLEDNSCVCEVGSFKNSLNCYPCGDTCETCNGSDSDNCLSCHNNMTLENDSCICEEGSFENSLNCYPCDDTCETCNGSDPNNCLSCYNNMELENNYCICVAGTYEDNLRCFSCDSSCKTCNGGLSTDCLDCYDAMNFQNGTCSCPDGTAQSGEICEDCDSSCLTCNQFTENDCLSCHNNMILQNSACTCNEPTIVVNNKCEDCPLNCSSCAYLDSTIRCLQCESEMYYIENGECIQCGEDCLRCEDNTECLECPEDFEPAGGGCECPSSFFSSEMRCFACSDYCVSCEDERTCLECEELFAVKDGNCDCQDGYFFENDTCKPCPAFCRVCSSSFDCEGCNPTFALINGSCECPSNYILEESSCVYNTFLFSISSQLSFLVFSFTQPLALALSEPDFLQSYFVPSGTSFTVEIETLSLSEFKITISAISVPRNTTGIFVELSGLRSVSSEVLEGREKEFPIETAELEGMVEEEEVIEEPVLLGEVSSEDTAVGATAVGGSASVGISLISANPSAIWVFLNLVILIYYMPLQNVRMPVEVTNFSKGFALDIVSIVPGLDSISFLNNTAVDAPERWVEYGIETTDLITNNRNCLLFLSLGFLVLILASFVLIVKRNKESKVRQKAMGITGMFRWCFFLRLWIVSYIKLIVSGVLGISTIAEEGLNIKQMTSIFILALGGASIIIFVGITYAKREEIYLKKNLRNFETLFAEFKCDKGFLSLLYYPLFLLRRYCYIVGLYFLEDFPLIQVIMNSVLSFLVVIHLLRYKPFKDSSANLVNIITESIIGVLFGISGLFLLDLSKDTNSAITKLIFALAGFIIMVIMVSCIVNFVMMIRAIRRNKKIMADIDKEVNTSNIISLETTRLSNTRHNIYTFFNIIPREFTLQRSRSVYIEDKEPNDI